MKQNHKIIAGVLLFIALVAFVFGESVFRLCRLHIYPWACSEFFLQTRGWFVMLSVPFLIITPILFFVRRETFMAWAIFAAIAFPIMLGGLLYAFNMPQSSGGWVSGPNEAQIASFLLPGLFIIISFIIIAVKSWKLRGK